MSLTVSKDLLDQAKAGEVDDAAFVACVRDSLPYAWSVITELVRQRDDTGAEFADNTVPPPDEAARGQLLRCLASDSMRGALERHFGMRLAFQNCHRVAVFDPAATKAHAEFVTARSQILNQTPELVDC
ncbi:SCO5389 family protein [Streptosporangium sp. NBC_01639]|uniref:SCO5389 family protein n=1 Tax=unclassified Streptosporangium TaxID=2632669 RepID=UPI002DDB03AB|nr:SCO5389 family protein [Streptosporangium sp. NBC_01756]WSC90141.1 SCO5389 family protein [Streptosporangium sp. NBC_01756]WTD51254.1 SCO5389 family protein [Streptosporangium sp. NBC_01639]